MNGQFVPVSDKQLAELRLRCKHCQSRKCDSCGLALLALVAAIMDKPKPTVVVPLRPAVVEAAPKPAAAVSIPKAMASDLYY